MTATASSSPGNEQNYRATITRELAGDVDQVVANLRHLVPMSDAEAAEILKTSRSAAPSRRSASATTSAGPSSVPSR
jgi:hypothetical protein